MSTTTIWEFEVELPFHREPITEIYRGVVIEETTTTIIAHQIYDEQAYCQHPRDENSFAIREISRDLLVGMEKISEY